MPTKAKAEQKAPPVRAGGWVLDPDTGQWVLDDD